MVGISIAALISRRLSKQYELAAYEMSTILERNGPVGTETGLVGVQSPACHICYVHVCFLS